MKIAIVSFYVMESTIPLSKYISKEGVEVEVYSLLPQSRQNAYVFDLSSKTQPNGFVNSKVVKSAFGERLNNYIKNIRTKVFIFPDSKLARLFLMDFLYAYRLARYMKTRKYDLVHIIHTSRRFWFFLYFFFEKKKVVQTLHEVTSHEGKTPFLDAQKLIWLIKNSTPIIFHSEVSKNRFLEFRKSITSKKIQEDKIQIIRFGLFETFRCVSYQSFPPILNDKTTILTFGRIVRSKGIDYLIEAVKLLQNKYPIHLIIAGAGEPYFDFCDIKSYEFINRIITNEEIVTLIKRSDMVVLPYTSTSQSGIPMTVYAFDKPIVASNVDGLKEVIDNFKTGILVNNLNNKSLAESIEILITDTNLKNKMSENIRSKYSEGDFSWSRIASETIEFYENQLGKKKTIETASINE
jgi:glycosyltransferase involved in cell wall biosynthesis